MTRVSLVEAAYINPPPRRRPAAHENVSFLSMSEVDVDGRTGSGTLRPFGEVSKGYTLFERGDVLVAKITPCFENGKIAQAATTSDVAAGSTEFHVVRPVPGVADPRYILHFLRHPHVRSAGERRMTGSGGQRRVPEAFLRDLQVLLPPIEEQRRIAAVLDHADHLRSVNQTADDLAKSFSEAAVQDVLRSISADRARWPQLGEFADIQGGLQVFSSRSQYRMRVPYLRVANVYRGRLVLDEVKQLGVTPAELERTRLQFGDLLIVEGHGNRDEIGRVGRWQDEINDCVHQNHLIRVRVHPSMAYSRYVEAFLNSKRGRRALRRAARTTSGLNTISTGDVRSIPVPLPALDIQARFDAQLAKCSRLQQTYMRRNEQIGGLFESLLHRAFRGELNAR